MLLSELLTLKYGKSQSEMVDSSGAIPIYGTSGIMGWGNDFLYDKPSILFGRKGSINYVQFVNKPFWCIDTTFYSKINEKFVLPKYLYYKLSLIDFSVYDEGTTMPSLRIETLNNINVAIHSITEQQHIVDTI